LARMAPPCLTIRRPARRRPLRETWAVAPTLPRTGPRTSDARLRQVGEGPEIQPYAGYRLDKKPDGSLSIVLKPKEAPVAPVEATSPPVEPTPVQPEIVAPAAPQEPISAVPAPSPLRPGRLRGTRAPKQTPNDALADWRAEVKRSGVKPDSLLSEANTGMPSIPGLQRKTAGLGWDQHLRVAEEMGLDVGNQGPEDFARLLRGKNVEKSADAMMWDVEQYWLSQMSPEAQDAARVYGSADKAMAALENQRAVLTKSGEPTTAVDALLSEFKGDQQATLLNDDPFAGQRPEEFTPPEDDLFSPPAPVKSGRARGTLPVSGAVDEAGWTFKKDTGFTKEIAGQEVRIRSDKDASPEDRFEAVVGTESLGRFSTAAEAKKYADEEMIARLGGDGPSSVTMKNKPPTGPAPVKPKRTPPPAKGSTSSTGWSTVAKGVARKDIMGRNVEIVRQADGSWSVTRDEQEMDSGYKSRAEAEKYADGELAQDIRDQRNAEEEERGVGEATQEDVVSFEDAKFGDVYKVRIGQEDRYAVRENMDNPRGGGDPLYSSFDEARTEFAKDQERKSLNASRQAEG
jgi:hypothetical protein